MSGALHTSWPHSLHQTATDVIGTQRKAYRVFEKSDGSFGSDGVLTLISEPSTASNESLTMINPSRVNSSARLLSKNPFLIFHEPLSTMAKKQKVPRYLSFVACGGNDKCRRGHGDGSIATIHDICFYCSTTYALPMYCVHVGVFVCVWFNAD